MPKGNIEDDIFYIENFVEELAMEKITGQLYTMRVPYEDIRIMDCGACAGYLRAIEHDLSPVKIQALEKYFAFLVSRGEVPESAVPVKIFS